MWVGMIFANLAILLTIPIFRYDLVQQRTEIAGLILYRPFLLPLLANLISPSMQINTYIFDYYNCETRSHIFPYSFGYYIQQTVTFVCLIYVLIIAVVSKILANNQTEEDRKKNM